MKVLLDTHVLLWWLCDSTRLRAATRELLADPGSELVWSAASTWEIAIKLALGRLHLDRPLAEFTNDVIRAQHLVALPLHHVHAAAVATLPPLHRDPFDRLLVAQARVEALPLLTADAALAAYDIECLPA
jgi:PIN domain nuclease of toxin-antitoxin system